VAVARAEKKKKAWLASALDKVKGVDLGYVGGDALFFL